MIVRRMAIAAVSLVALTTACKKSTAEMDATRKQWIDSAPACPAPATCSGKVTAATREYSICAPAPTTYAAGDLVIVKEPTTMNALGKLKEAKGDGWNVEFADGYVLHRASGLLVSRICK